MDSIVDEILKMEKLKFGGQLTINIFFLRINLKNGKSLKKAEMFEKVRKNPKR
jgi:hypothetical protein